jgi:hypothetical protein
LDKAITFATKSKENNVKRDVIAIFQSPKKCSHSALAKATHPLTIQLSPTYSINSILFNGESPT